MSTPLQEFWAGFDEAWNRHDARAVATLFEDTARLLFIDGRLFSGRTALEEFYRDAFTRLPREMSHTAMVESETGWSGEGLFRILHADGKNLVLAGRYEIELSTRRLIQQLTLKSREPAVPS